MSSGIVLILMLFTFNTYAWGFVGHEIVASIAYEHLTPEARKAVDELTIDDSGLDGKHRFLLASSWADKERVGAARAYKQWHYIKLPIIRDGIVPKSVPESNLVLGLQTAYLALLSESTTFDNKKLYLKLLVHLAGEASQPLHCSDLYSKNHPNGDHGGNDYKIKYSGAGTLHEFWDKGAGEFNKFYGKQRAGSVEDIIKIADQIDLWYNVYEDGEKPYRFDPMGWVQLSNRIADSFAYTVPENDAPSAEYIELARNIIHSQLHVSGRRLAATLNSIYSGGKYHE